MPDSTGEQPTTSPKEQFDDVAREFIDFVNRQVGAYMDAMAGFAGHHTRVERQMHRVLRRARSANPDATAGAVVWASYEDPTQPDVIHNRIIRAEDYLATNARGGSNEQQQARAVLVFLFTYWEDEIRPRLAACSGVEVNAVRSDIMGDLRIVRHAILHSKSILRAEKHKGLKVVGNLFEVDKPLDIGYEDMHKIFVLVKQDCARLMIEPLGVKDAAGQASQLVDIAIQKLGPPGSTSPGNVP